MSLTTAELKLEAMRAANQAMSTAMSYRAAGMANGIKTCNPSEVLEEAKRIYAWLTEDDTPKAKPGEIVPVASRDRFSNKPNTR